MTAKELVAKVKNLPPVSNAALRLVNLLDQPSIGNDDVVQVIKCDNVLTAKLLRACNSPYFGFTEPVTSVDQAVLILGHQQILHIVLTLAFGTAMVVPLPGYAVEANELWHHSLTTAVAAEVVVNSGLDLNVEPPVAFTVGLLHDIGKLVMGQVLTPDLQAAIRDRIAGSNVSRAEAEREVLNTDHSEVGAFLLQSWNLPEEIVEAVGNHHQPVLEPHPRLSVVAHIGNCVAHLAGSAPGWEAFGVRVESHVAERFEITPARLENMVVTVRESSAVVDNFMTLT
jgi:putative nucleotidyltransferase with HDIG domain